MPSRAASGRTPAPTNEKGTQGGFNGSGGLLVLDPLQQNKGYSEMLRESLEHVPDLKWMPNGQGATKVWHQMRGDAQVQGLFLASTLPVRRYSYFLDQNHSREEMLQKFSADYNLRIKGAEDQPRRRSQKRFSFKQHQRWALLAMLYGHMYFEQKAPIGSDGLAHLTKLAPRWPLSIDDVRVDEDGGLRSIVQRTPGRNENSGGMGMMGRVELKANRLLAYIWEQEGDWIGRSSLRGIYKNWLLKDRVLRVGAINIARAGGVPVVKMPRDATPEDQATFVQFAKQFRIGDDAGGALPHDAELDLAKAAGGDDAVNFIKLMNEEMGRGFLLMFLNLGQTTSGSRALGGSFVDFALQSGEAIADWFCDTFNEHQLEDDAEWNYDLKPDETIPYLGYHRQDDRQLAIQDLTSMIDKGLIQVDDELENWIREEYRMPARGKTAREPKQPPQSKPSPEAGVTAEQGERPVPGSSPLLGRSQARADVEDLGLNPDVLKEAIKQQLLELVGSGQ
jgi:hypothetical protein